MLLTAVNVLPLVSEVTPDQAARFGFVVAASMVSLLMFAAVFLLGLAMLSLLSRW